MKKICFASSSGGHFEQLLMLRPLMEKYESFILTEETLYMAKVPGIRVRTLHQINRHELLFPVKFLANSFRSLAIFLKERPDMVITTGVLAVIPMCLLCKLFGRKLVYIESFAKVSSPTLTGKLMYKFADRFFVQWESMLEIYPKAECLGGIY